MSKHESWRTRKYWSSTGGLLIEEFRAVKTTKANGRRSIDGVIVLNEESRIYDGNFYNIEVKRGRVSLTIIDSPVVVMKLSSNRERWHRHKIGVQNSTSEHQLLIQS